MLLHTNQLALSYGTTSSQHLLVVLASRIDASAPEVKNRALGEYYGVS